ncbi:unnamed protein product [Acanthoscelides obtectus]|uniref:Uncharacterized protein n=1 Tax=Acanthoscelides obtectus TaxID=200917 RepID=A0A9P0PCU3_ACAOB|nr:unnamed protein product [Acanthoscelides obtectus]CAK1631856.1 hypothetical protein AOBTE_LOCUS7206 [Acanthoscelides obtectus]
MTFFELFGAYDVRDYCNDFVRSEVNGLKVVYNNEEIRIALIKKLNGSVRDEQQKQLLLRVVGHHRKAVPKRIKEGISSYRMD